MKLVPVGETHALVDDEDYALLMRYRWFPSAKGYARANRPRSEGIGSIYMARLILGLETGDRREADHKDGNKLNNQRSNLRIVGDVAQAQNRTFKNSTGHRGVQPKGSKFEAYAYRGGRRVYLGLHTTPELAAEAAANFRRETGHALAQ